MKRQLLKFYHHLSLLLQAGMQLDHALSAILKTEPKQKMQDLLQVLKTNLHQGYSFSQALETFVPKDHLAFIRTGESIGQLAQTLSQLVSFIEQQKSINDKLKKAIRYPSCMLLCVTFITLGIFYFVLPQYQQFFHDFNAKLPLITHVLLYIAHILQTQVINLFIIVVALFLLIYCLFQSDMTQYYFDYLLLKVPSLQSLLKQYSFYRWFDLLALCCRMHLPLLESIQLANQSINNKYLIQKFHHLEAHLIQGKSLFEILSQTQCIETEVLQLIQIGENSGNLTICLTKIAHYYQNLLSHKFDKMLNALEPITMLLLASITGTIVIGLYLPMVNFGLHLH